MILRSLSLGIVILGFALIGTAAVFSWLEPPTERGTTLEAPAIQLGSVPVQDVHEFSVPVRNVTGESLQVFGLEVC